MLEWIKTAFDAVTCFVPRFQRVPPNHSYIKWKRCKKPEFYVNGIFWYWPLVSEIEYVDIRSETFVSMAQSVMTSDLISVSVRTSMTAKILDPIRAVTENSNHHDKMSDLQLGAVADTVAMLDQSRLGDRKFVIGLLESALSYECAKLGYELESVKLVEFVITPCYRIINGE